MSEVTVLYTDGGCKPSRGRGGWGVHGVIGDSTYDAWGSFEHDTTNNVAEIVAATEGLKIAMDKDVSRLTIRTDSKYVIQGITKGIRNWKQNGWLNSMGEPIKNKVEWETLDNAYQNFVDRDSASITWEYVKGHSGEPGNEAADLNATRGVIMSQKNIVENYLNETPTKKYQKFKPAKYNRLMCHPRAFLTGPTKIDERSSDGRYVYYLGTDGKVEDMIGSRSTDAHHSVVFLKEPDEALDVVHKFQDESYKQGVELPVVVRTDHIFSPKIHSELIEHGDRFLRPHAVRKDIITCENTNLTEVLQKPLLAHKLMSMFSGLRAILERYVKGELESCDNTVVTDITDHFYEVTDGKKPKTILKKSMDSSVKYVDVAAKHKCNGEVTDVPLRLTVGKDLPTRNSLSAIACEGIKVSVVTWVESKHGFRYVTIVETPDDVGLFTAGHANLRLLTDSAKDAKDGKRRTKKK